MSLRAQRLLTTGASVLALAFAVLITGLAGPGAIRGLVLYSGGITVLVMAVLLVNQSRREFAVTLALVGTVCIGISLHGDTEVYAIVAVAVALVVSAELASMSSLMGRVDDTARLDVSGRLSESMLMVIIGGIAAAAAGIATTVEVRSSLALVVAAALTAGLVAMVITTRART
jgi:hypothetical protein